MSVQVCIRVCVCSCMCVFSGDVSNRRRARNNKYCFHSLSTGQDTVENTV